MSCDYYLSERDRTADEPVAHSYWGGSAVGAVVTEYVPLLDAQPLLDEYGQWLTVAELRKRSGHGKGASSLAEVGELFGYGEP